MIEPRHWTRSVLMRITGAAFAPFLVLTVYLFLSRWPVYRFTSMSDYVCFAAATLIGSCFIATLPLGWWGRAILLAGYVPLIAYLLFFYSFGFIAFVFHDGL